MKKPKLIKGNLFVDERGKLSFNNDFDFSEIKRIYFIENVDTNFVRGWKGHKIEKRWFSAVIGSFLIKVITLNDWGNYQKQQIIYEFKLSAQTLDILFVPNGSLTSIQALEENSKLLVLADYFFGETNDEASFENNYFEAL